MRLRGAVGRLDQPRPTRKSDRDFADIVGLYAADAPDQDLLHRAGELAALPESWRDYFRKRL